MIHYEAICLGEVVGSGTYLMLDLANFKLIALSDLLKNIANDKITGDVDVKTIVNTERTYRISFINIEYNVQTNKVEYKDGVEEYKHYKINFVKGYRFKFSSAELLILGKIANRFVIFSPGYSDKLAHVEMSEANIDKMFFGFQNIMAQAGCITVLDEEFTIGINKVMKYKYMNAKVSLPSGRKGYVRSYANGFPQLLKSVSDKAVAQGNARDIAIYMLRVALSANETSKLIDKNFPEKKEELKAELANLGKSLSSAPNNKEDKILNEMYLEIIRLFNSSDETDNIFNIEAVKNIYNTVKNGIEKRERDMIEAAHKKESNSKPVTDLAEFTKNYLEGVRTELGTAGFKVKSIRAGVSTSSDAEYFIDVIKNRQAFVVNIRAIVSGEEETPFHTRITALYENERVSVNECKISKEETVKTETEFRGLCNTVGVTRDMHNKIYWHNS